MIYVTGNLNVYVLIHTTMGVSNAVPHAMCFIRLRSYIVLAANSNCVGGVEITRYDSEMLGM